MKSLTVKKDALYFDWKKVRKNHVISSVVNVTLPLNFKTTEIYEPPANHWILYSNKILNAKNFSQSLCNFFDACRLSVYRKYETGATHSWSLHYKCKFDVIRELPESTELWTWKKRRTNRNLYFGSQWSIVIYCKCSLSRE